MAMERDRWVIFSDDEIKLLHLALSAQMTDDEMSEHEDEICVRLHNEVRNHWHDRNVDTVKMIDRTI